MIPGAIAQEPKGVVLSGPVQAVTGAVEQIRLTIGKGGLFQTSMPYAKISVTDEKIVDATPQSDRDFVFNPKGIGTTNVFIFDEKNTLLAKLDVTVVEKSTDDVIENANGSEPNRIRIYNRIYNDQGGLAKPALYSCNHKNCQDLSEATNAGPGPTETPAPKSGAGAAPDSPK